MAEDSGTNEPAQEAEPQEPTPRAPVWREDEPEEATGEDAESGDSEPEAGEEPATEEAAKSDEEPKEDGWNKPLQKLQQRQTTQERELKGIRESQDKLAESISELATILKSGAPSAVKNEAAAEQRQQIENDLKALKDELGNAEFIEGKQATKLLDAIEKQLAQALAAKPKDSDDAKALVKEVKDLKAEIAEIRRVEQVWSKFDAEHDGVFKQGEGRAVWQAIVAQTQKKFPNRSAEFVAEWATEQFDAQIEERVKKAKTPATPTDKPKPIPPKSPAGTQTVKPGATTVRATAMPVKKRPPVYVAD